MRQKIMFSIFILFCLMVIPPASAIVFNGQGFSNLVFSDDFEYSSNFDDWAYENIGSSCPAVFPTAPYDFSSLGYYNSSRAFGFYNLSSPCGSAATIHITWTGDDVINSGYALYSWDLGLIASHNKYTYYKIKCGNYNTFSVQTFPHNSTHYNMSVTNYRTGGEDWLYTEHDPLAYDGIDYFKLFINFDSAQYIIYNGDTQISPILALGTEGEHYCLKDLDLTYNGDAGDNYSMYFDNIAIYTTTGATSNLTLQGYPCDTHTDCISNYCEPKLHICMLKPNNYDCVEDYECRSGDCYNGKCTKPSLMQNIDAGKTETFGDDPATNNFISLVIMLFVAGLVMFGGMTTDHIGMGVAGGLMFFIVLGIFFTLIGWLSGFIMLGVLLILIILSFIGFMIVGG